MKVFDNFPASLIAKGQPLLRGTSLELPLYVEQLPNLIYGFLRSYWHPLGRFFPNPGA